MVRDGRHSNQVRAPDWRGRLTDREVLMYAVLESVAQLVEREPVKLLVAGSIPA